MFSQVERKCPFRSVPDVLAVHSGRIGPGRQELGLDGKERVKVLTSNRIQNSLKGLIYPFLAAHNDVGMDLARIDEIPVSRTYGCFKLGNDGGSTSASLPTISL